MIEKTTLCLTAVFSAALAAFACLTGPSARAEYGTKHRGEIMVETSWYPQSAAYAGQKNGFVYLEARPELVIYGNSTEARIQPRISSGTAGDGRIDFREAHVTARLGDADILVGSTILFLSLIHI